MVGLSHGIEATRLKEAWKHRRNEAKLRQYKCHQFGRILHYSPPLKFQTNSIKSSSKILKMVASHVLVFVLFAFLSIMANVESADPVAIIDGKEQPCVDSARNCGRMFCGSMDYRRNENTESCCASCFAIDPTLVNVKANSTTPIAIIDGKEEPCADYRRNCGAVFCSLDDRRKENTEYCCATCFKLDPTSVNVKV